MRWRLGRVRRGVLGTGLVAALAVGSVAAGIGVAAADPSPAPGPSAGAELRAALPPGWRLRSDRAGVVLTWRAPSAVPIGNARIEVRNADGDVLGAPVVAPDRRSLSLAVPSDTTAGELAGLRVTASGRRLDGETVTRRPPAAAAAPARAARKAIDEDPGRSGPYRTRSGTYQMPALQVPGLKTPVEIEGVVVAPVAAPGPRPLVLFLHGRHGTCYTDAKDPNSVRLAWPCPAGAHSIPSYRGYLQAQKLLASQGFLTVSIGANGVNAQDGNLPDAGMAARSAVVRHHLDLWRGWQDAPGSAPKIVRDAPGVDLSRVLLVGHSRGGEGVNAAAQDSLIDGTTGRPAPWRIAGIVHLAPTAFGQNPAPGVSVTSLLPYCDGDVYDLEGQLYVDGLRDVAADGVLRSSALVLGANHNFFNAEWTPGLAEAPAVDDWFEPADPVCGNAAPGSQRISAAAQRAAGATYIAASARAFLLRDPAAATLLDGSGVRAPSAGDVTVLTHALGGRRVPVVTAGTTQATDAPTVTGEGGVRAAVCLGNDDVDTCVDPAPVSSPHFITYSYLPDPPTPRGIKIDWSAAGGQATIATGTAVSLAGRTNLALRVAQRPGAGPARASVELQDARGRTASLGQITVASLPASANVAREWAQELRLPLAAAKVIDLNAVTHVRLRPVSDAGNLLVLDVWGQQPGLTSPSSAARLPRLDVGVTRVEEGNDPAIRTVTVPITQTEPRSGSTTQGPRRVHVMIFEANDEAPESNLRSFTTTVQPGQRTFTVPVSVVGNTIDNGDVTRIQVTVKPVTGLTAGTVGGGADVVDDEPTPTVTITRTATATEGAPLQWTATLSAPSAIELDVYFVALQPDAGAAELSTDDVVPNGGVEGVNSSLYFSGEQTQALSAEPAYGLLQFIPGQTTATLTAPTVTDDRTEGTEAIVLEVLDPAQLGGLPTTAPLGLSPGDRLTGTVRDPA